MLYFKTKGKVHMIEINDKKYTNYDIEIVWGKFLIMTKEGNKRMGVAPFITFSVKKDLQIGLEFTFSKEMFESLNEGIKTDMKTYIYK